jgi:hypothetical protein
MSSLSREEALRLEWSLLWRKWNTPVRYACAMAALSEVARSQRIAVKSEEHERFDVNPESR